MQAAFRQSSSDLRQLQLIYQHTPTEPNKSQWIAAKQTFELCQENLALLTQDHNELKYHSFGSKPGKLLSYLTKDKFAPVSTSTMKDEKGEKVKDPTAINTIFKNYYQKLYNKPMTKTKDMTTFLDAIDLPQITEEQNKILNESITTEEMTKVINGLAPNKSPGPDGFGPEFYKVMKEEISPTLQLLYTHMTDTPEYFPTGNLAHIRVIPKQGKDRELRNLISTDLAHKRRREDNIENISKKIGEHFTVVTSQSTIGIYKREIGSIKH